MLANFALLSSFQMLAQDIEDWGNILILVVMAILWLVGSLAKILAGKRGNQPREPEASTKQRAQRETWQQRLARKAEELQRAAEKMAGQTEQKSRPQPEAQGPHPSHAPRRAPRPPAGTITTRPGRKGEPVMVYERPSATEPIDRDQQLARQQQAREAVASASQQATKLPLTSPAADQRQAASPALLQPGLFVDYSDPDALTRAILSYEILGRPLALRDPTENTTSF